MTPLTIGAVIVSYAVGTGLAVQVAREYYVQHQSASAVLAWALFYVMGVVAPWVWMFRHQRLLRELDLHDRRFRYYLAAPVVAGGLTFLFGLRLIIGAR
jgi:hypothetical protein